MALQQPVPDQAIRDTLARILTHDGYDRSLRETAWQRFWSWLLELFQPAGRALRESPLAQRLALALIVLLVVAIIARIVIVAYGGRIARAAEREGRSGRGRAGRLADPWMEAQRLAEGGDYTAAAHAAYEAVLLALRARARVRLHPSKTVGDYVRELRRLQSPLAPAYREFARLYEVVIYGVGTCDAARWARLHALAADLVERDRAAA